MMKKRILSAVQPTGQLTLGNYLGAIRNWVPMQDEGECLFFTVDLHAITVPYDPKVLQLASLEAMATYMACGITPEKSILFVQSMIPAHSELSWLFSTMTPLGWLYRMTQFKDKAGKHKDNASLGLLAYPVLMAADILLYKTTHVPVGEDQKQHLELARDLAGLFNRTYGQDVFPLPEPEILGPAPRVMSLRDGTKKMSKSDPSDYSRIHLLDSDEEIVQKIRKAKTDPLALPGTEKELDGRPEAENLLTIYAALTAQTLEHTCAQFAGASFSDFKKNLADLLVASLSPIRAETLRLLTDRAQLEAILRDGANRAQAIATPTMAEVHALMGFLKA